MVTSLQAFALKEDSLLIQWKNGGQSEFHYTWLLDNAPPNRDKWGNKKDFSTELLPLLKPNQIKPINGRYLGIKWKREEDFIPYSLSWLQKYAFQKPVSQTRLWDSRFEDLPIGNYNEMMRRDSPLRTFLKGLATFGIGIVEGIGTTHQAREEFIRRFSQPYDNYWAENMNNALKSGMHTASPYRTPVPDIRVLHHLGTNNTGCSISIIDGLRIAEDLRKVDQEIFEQLTSVLVKFASSHEAYEYSHETNIIKLNSNQEILQIIFDDTFIQPFQLAPNKLSAFYEAYSIFKAILEEPIYQIQLNLTAGSLLVIDNQRVLTDIGSSSTQSSIHESFASKADLLSRLRILNKI